MAKYGTNFRYLGIVRNGIDRVTVVTSILIPIYENVKIRPINFAKCAQSLEEENKGIVRQQILRHLKWLKSGVHRPFCIWSI